ncbi:hypothetical protein [Stetteria hydrogenophila]
MGLSLEAVARAMAEVVSRAGWGKPRVVVFVAYGGHAYREMVEGVKSALGEPSECPAGLRVFP